MTLNQLALASGGDVKWLQNAAALLKRDLKRTPAEARLWALIRMLVSGLDLPLKIALEIARKALRMERVGVEIVVNPDNSRVASVVVDLSRFESIFNGNFSSAMILEMPKQRGRPKIVRGNPIDDARRYGIDITLLQSALTLTVAERLERLSANAEFLRQLRMKR